MLGPKRRHGACPDGVSKISKKYEMQEWSITDKLPFQLFAAKLFQIGWDQCTNNTHFEGRIGFLNRDLQGYAGFLFLVSTFTLQAIFSQYFMSQRNFNISCDVAALNPVKSFGAWVGSCYRLPFSKVCDGFSICNGYHRKKCRSQLDPSPGEVSQLRWEERNWYCMPGKHTANTTHWKPRKNKL